MACVLLVVGPAFRPYRNRGRANRFLLRRWSAVCPSAISFLRASQPLASVRSVVLALALEQIAMVEEVTIMNVGCGQELGTGVRPIDLAWYDDDTRGTLGMYLCRSISYSCTVRSSDFVRQVTPYLAPFHPVFNVDPTAHGNQN
jgi:hypothetical protein